MLSCGFMRNCFSQKKKNCIYNLRLKKILLSHSILFLFTIMWRGNGGNGGGRGNNSSSSGGGGDGGNGGNGGSDCDGCLL